MRRKVLQKIQKKIRSFDLCTLIRLLETLGFQKKEIYFISHFQRSSPSTLCEKIKFTKETPRVHITLNMGLLSNNTSLPSYLIKYIEEREVDSDRFLRFLGFFNHHLIQEFLKLTIPEKNHTLFSNWRETHYHYLSLLGFESISTLWLLFKGCFPELVVRIQKNIRTMKLHSNTLILGKNGLGASSCIGERLEQTLSSFRITFTTEEEISELGVPWPVEINSRLLDWMFPILQKTDLHLSIILRIKHKYGQLHLAENNYLGFDRIGHSNHSFQLLLFHGFIKDFKKNIYLSG